MHTSKLGIYVLLVNIFRFPRIIFLNIFQGFNVYRKCWDTAVIIHFLYILLPALTTFNFKPVFLHTKHTESGKMLWPYTGLASLWEFWPLPASPSRWSFTWPLWSMHQPWLWSRYKIWSSTWLLWSSPGFGAGLHRGLLCGYCGLALAMEQVYKGVFCVVIVV